MPNSLSPNTNLGKDSLSSPHTRPCLGGAWEGIGAQLPSRESRVQNKEEIQGGRAFLFPGRAPAAIWWRGCCSNLWIIGQLFFGSLQLGMFIKFSTTNCVHHSFCKQISAGQESFPLSWRVISWEPTVSLFSHQGVLGQKGPSPLDAWASPQADSNSGDEGHRME